MEIESWMGIAAISGAALSIGLGAVGSAIGEGHTAACASEAIGRSPDKSGDILKNMLVGQAIAETAAIFALLVAMILLFTDIVQVALISAFVLLAAGISMGFGAIGAGIGSGIPAGASCLGIDRQPSFSGKITTNMLIGSAVCQTPAIFALAVSFILLFTDFSVRPLLPTWAAILGAGFAAGLGAVGSGLGGGFVAGASCKGVARNPKSASIVTNIMLLGQAVTQTTAIYRLLISFILMFKTVPATSSLSAAMALLGAGLCMGIGAIGPGIGEGLTARSAVDWISRNLEATADLTRTMLVGQAVAESTGIYALVVALMLIFVI
ncbi:MAG: ATP synthase F0 subunit C [Desulfosudaceae bacterium]